MSIDPDTEERLAKLIRMLSAAEDGVVLNAARAIQRTLNGAGADIHELAARVEGGKLTEAEMRKIYDAGHAAGVEVGRNDAAIDRGFDSVDGKLGWHEMALACASRSDQLEPREQKFIDDMVRWTERREPSEKQGNWLHAIFYRIGRRR